MKYKTTSKNEERAARAEGALDTYSRMLGEGGRVDCDTVRDLIQDIMHWKQQDDPDCDARETIKEAFESAYGDFQFEAEGVEQ